MRRRLTINEESTAKFYISEELRNDKDIAKKLLSQSSNYFIYFSDELKDDENITMIAVEKYGSTI